MKARYKMDDNKQSYIFWEKIIGIIDVIVLIVMLVVSSKLHPILSHFLNNTLSTAIFLIAITGSVALVNNALFKELGRRFPNRPTS